MEYCDAACGIELSIVWNGIEPRSTLHICFYSSKITVELPIKYFVLDVQKRGSCNLRIGLEV